MNEDKKHVMTEQEILAAPEADYMNDAQLAFFEKRLIELYESTCEHIERAKSEVITPMEFSDESDRASSEEQSAIALRIIDREQKLLPKIQQSLARLREGEYGYCLSSGEPIGIPRLLARPTAEYSTEVKTQMESKEHWYKH
ncbi:molecular chaperone DnaK [Vibrio sp. HI00D65]|uniref:TraR/DksA C4-type zinc finger protein n=1 Tax=Vibrio sp. HI00D65 TaxID=1822216 RepID=UPI0007B7C79D|nr:TraR/DksA C4-type zinc finger protein [Vibrio sp. HI00D65]KZX69770.1 molecular chaperone DnaK [Vibrio sp. HI00D65]